jgi:hypothetical protein
MPIVFQTPLTRGSLESPWRALLISARARPLARLTIILLADGRADVTVHPFGATEALSFVVALDSTEPPDVGDAIERALLANGSLHLSATPSGGR